MEEALVEEEDLELSLSALAWQRRDQRRMYSGFRFFFLASSASLNFRGKKSTLSGRALLAFRCSYNFLVFRYIGLSVSASSRASSARAA